MKKNFFKLIAKLNKKVLPSYLKKDPSKLSKMQQAVLGFRYYILMQSLDD